MKTLSMYGRATAAPWRHALVRGVASGDPERLVVVVVVVWLVVSLVCYRLYARYMLAGRCRGTMGAGELELASKVQW